MKKTIIILAVLLTALVFAICFDHSISLYVSSLRNGILDNIFAWASFTAIHYVGFGLLVYVLSFALFAKRKRKFLLPLLGSLTATIVISFISKAFINRTRPNLALGLKSPPVKAVGSSFPSAHTALAFSALPFFYLYYIFGWFWLFFSCFVAFSRMYFGLHYLSDVIAGALLGYVIGLLFFNIEKIKERRQKRRERRRERKEKRKIRKWKR